MAVQTLNTQPITPGMALARNATFKQARDAFGSRMLDITQIHKFATEHPNEFLGIMRQMSLHSKTLAVVSENPLGSFMQNGNLIVPSTYGDETRNLIIPEASLKVAGVDLNKANPLMLLHDGYILEQGGENGKEFTVTIDPAYGETLGQFIRMLTKPGADGWYAQIEGVPAGKPSNIDDANALYYWQGSQFGPVRRGGVCVYGDGRVVVVGWFDFRRGVLVHETGARAPAAAHDLQSLVTDASAIVMKELGRIPAELQKLFDALQQKQ